MTPVSWQARASDKSRRCHRVSPSVIVAARLPKRCGGFPAPSPLYRRCRCCRGRFLVWTDPGRLRFPCKTGEFSPRIIHKSLTTNAFRSWKRLCKRRPSQPEPQPSSASGCLTPPVPLACRPPPSRLAAAGTPCGHEAPRRIRGRSSAGFSRRPSAPDPLQGIARSGHSALPCF